MKTTGEGIEGRARIGEEMRLGGVYGLALECRELTFLERDDPRAKQRDVAIERSASVQVFSSFSWFAARPRLRRWACGFGSSSKTAREVATRARKARMGFKRVSCINGGRPRARVRSGSAEKGRYKAGSARVWRRRQSLDTHCYTEC